MLGERIPELGRLSAVWRRLLRCRLFSIAGWRRCLLIRSRKCSVVRGWTFPGRKTQDVREVGVSPGEMGCVEELSFIRSDSVVESPVYVWSVTGSLFFRSPLRRVQGLQQPPFPSRDPTCIVLVGFWLSCRLVWWTRIGLEV